MRIPFAAIEHILSQVKIQVLVFIHQHPAYKTTVSYLAQKFNFTKPTISDVSQVLEQKAS